MAKSRGYIAATEVPTPERPHRILSASGRTEADALIALAERLEAIGGPKHGEITVLRLSEV